MHSKAAVGSVFAVFAGALSLGCQKADPKPGPVDAPVADAAATADSSPDTAAPVNAAFAQRAQEIAAEYLAWGRVDDEWRWAPGLCRIPLPGVARPSQSNDTATHGNKLYSVFVKHRDAYPMGPHTDQVVVKQSWTAERVDTPDGGKSPYDPEQYSPATDAGDHFYPYAKGDDGTTYRAANPAGLYIMFKLDRATPDTDDGWVYATILPDGRVTAAGLVGSCQRCHEDAAHDRLFGVPKGAYGN